MTLATILKRAQSKTRAQGHRMRWEAPAGLGLGPQHRRGRCSACGETAIVMEGFREDHNTFRGEALVNKCPATVDTGKKQR